ncbi:MAG TPA: neutral zinc metallopeptidase [Methylomirabilota bacterium]
MRLSRGHGRNVEDRRGMVRRGAPLGIGVLLLLGVLSLVTGRNFLSLVDTGPVTAPVGAPRSPEEDARAQFASDVLDDVQGSWQQLLPGRYQDAVLVLYTGQTESACGYGSAASGPFYCPADQRVFLDLGFFDDLHRRFGAPGDFAQAYVIAHEIGHHVQNLLGIERQVRMLQQQRPDAANALSVRLELQADCLAGVWGRDAAQRGVLQAGDVEEGLNAAAAIGDDRLQRLGGGVVQPESFTHGSSADRVEWFRQGLEQGDPDGCDTFAQ